MDVLILFPHQLFAVNRALARGKRVVLVEDALYFRQYAFHKQKLVLHRATMRMHAEFLRKQAVQVDYLDFRNAPAMSNVMRHIAAHSPDTVHYIDPVDDWLERRLKREASAAGLSLRWHLTPMFLSSPMDLEDYFQDKRMFMASFYEDQRKTLDVLMEGSAPLGGCWSFDAENRKRLPRGIVLPVLWRPKKNPWVREATEYVERHFESNPGELADFKYPVTYPDARRWLTDFIERRLTLFGDYEDAISRNDSALFHSVLTPMLNIGLLTPREVLDAVLEAENIPLNSREGFVRQLIGWREFMRAAYILKGRRQRTRNFWRHRRLLPRAFWTGHTGVEPVDAVIARVLKHAYAHHIERLMILGNFTQLGGFDPDDVYRWFMEMFIDAYDWVMVPNVYGMALYADGGLISTKPYVAGSNYVRKMSDFPRGTWCDTWDSLFWSFIGRHHDFFAENHRLSMMARQFDRMPAERQARHAAVAKEFLASLQS